jgi:hypothetical protein
MMKSVPCKLHRTHFCSQCHWSPNDRATIGGGVGMDAASIPVVRKRAVSMDASPLSADEVQMLRGIISNHVGNPAPRQSVARRTFSVALDAYGQPASHPMAVNRPGEVQSSESLNDLYTRLKEEGRNGYKYEF